MKEEIEIHGKENNRDSQAHLEANEPHFKKQCHTVLTLLRKGVVLTSRIAMVDYNIGDVHRRIGELREGGIEGISDEWVMDKDGKKTRFKKWFMPQFVKYPNNTVYKKNEKASSDYSKELVKSTRKKTEPVHNPLFDNLKFD